MHSSAGWMPGLSKEKDDSGFRTYTRPEGKSGGHGVGWSEIPQYSFKVAEASMKMSLKINASPLDSLQSETKQIAFDC